MEIVKRFAHAGATAITLTGTTGLANTLQVTELVQQVQLQFGSDIKLGLHFHNTRGLGLANVLAGYQAGVHRFDSSIAGLSGCPFAPKAIGNACTEDMVNMFDGMGAETGTEFQKLIETAEWMQVQMERPLDGMLMKL